MDSQVRKVLEEVAAGVYKQNYVTGLGAWSQCHWCSRAPSSGHADFCPTLMAVAALEADDG